MKTSNVKQSAEFPASPLEVYDALMDSKKHSEFTGSQAKISAKVGGAFTTYDGYAEGKNIELVPGKKIVQTWRASDWPEGHESKITFKLSKSAKGTQLQFTQEGIPEGHEDVIEGWMEFYWQPLRAYFAERK